MEKNLEVPTKAVINARIAVLERELKKSGNQLGIDAKLGNGTVGGWNDNQIGKPTAAVEKFLQFYSISEDWWKTGLGDVFITPVQEAGNNKEMKSDHNQVYRTIVEGHTEYVLIPRSVLSETQLVSTEQINKTWQELAEKNKELERKNKQLDFYQEQFAKLMDNMELAPKPPKAKEV